MNTTFFKPLFVTGCVLFLMDHSVALADCYDRGDCETIRCWNAAEFDKDGDGYAYSEYKSNGKLTAGSADTQFRESFTIVENHEYLGLSDHVLAMFRRVRRKDRMTCPTGWVKSRGDCNDDPDDGGAEIHPRQYEVAYNSIDDNCNGQIDEPSLFYTPTGNNNNRTNFDIGFTINSQEVVDAIETPFVSVKVKIEYQRLKDTSETETKIRNLKSYYSYVASYKYGEVNLNGLSSNTVYRARIQFIKRTFSFAGGKLSVQDHEIGDPSGWYYSSTNGRSKLNKARTKILLKGFHQLYESNHHSLIGYLGTDTKDGMRYGADEGENWCAEFYSWVLQPFLKSVSPTEIVSEIRRYFRTNGLEKENPSDCDIEYHMKRGDFIGIATDTSEPHKATHASMFLAYDRHLDAVWTLDGNTHGFNVEPVTNDKKSRRAGNEVSIRVRNLELEFSTEEGVPPPPPVPLIKTWGKLRTKLVK